MQEERAASWGYTPVNAVPFVGATRDVFDAQVVLSENVFEPMPVRLKKPVPSNEVMCLPKDDVTRTCPQLAPPEPTVAPGWGTCGGPPPGQITDPNLLGDGYVSSFGVGMGGPLLFPGGPAGRPPRRAAPMRRWFFPPNPVAKGLKRRAGAGALTRDVVLGPKQMRVVMRAADGGAVRSIKWRGKEFLVQAGPKAKNAKGPALQMSVATNIPPGGNDQQRRANEAGAAWNAPGESASRLVEVHTGGVSKSNKCADRFVRAAFTRVQAAWWRRPGEVVGRARVLNNGTLSPYVVAKRVSAAPGGFLYTGGVRLPAVEAAKNVRIATRFSLRREFNRVLAFHNKTQRWVALPRSRALKVGRYRALAVTNAAGTAAIGFTLREFPKPPKQARLRPNAYYAVNVTNRAPGTLVSVVHQVGVRGGATPLPARMWPYHLTFKVGTLKSVTRRLANLAINIPLFNQRFQVGGPADKRPACAAAKKTWKQRPLGQCLTAGDLGDARGAAAMLKPAAKAGKAWKPAGAGAAPKKKKAAKAGMVRVCTVLAHQACKNRKCTPRSTNAACKPCVKCRWVRRAERGADEVLAKDKVCKVKRLARCKGCGPKNMALPRCKGCVSCRTVKKVTRTPAPAGTKALKKKCVVRKTKACKGCGLGSKAKRCKGCVVCTAGPLSAAAKLKRAKALRRRKLLKLQAARKGLKLKAAAAAKKKKKGKGRLTPAQVKAIKALKAKKKAGAKLTPAQVKAIKALKGKKAGAKLTPAQVKAIKAIKAKKAKAAAKKAGKVKVVAADGGDVMPANAAE